MTIITPQRLNALCNINRWRGWTVRPYSVAEHCCIGATVLHWFQRPDEQVAAFWLHDMHETEIVGDVPRPDKARYMSPEYFEDVAAFDRMLGREAGLSKGWHETVAIKKMDHLMMCVENDYIASQRDPTLPTPDYDDPVARMIRKIVMDGHCQKPEVIFRHFEQHGMWERVES